MQIHLQPSRCKRLTQHSTTAVSSSRLLTDYGAKGSTGLSSTVRKRLIKAHAILMILAWFFFVPTAVMFARFLRASWPTMKPGGLLIWFHVHRTFNTTAILLSIASFICILTANSWEWTGPGSQSSEWGKKHTMVGIFALCLCWIQPFVSAMSHGRLHRRRSLFEYLAAQDFSDNAVADAIGCPVGFERCVPVHRQIYRCG
ncbi:hypothetical protein ANCCAN_19270 [Ancylostoma caninum]|uniref:ascorbate ferrireductase (transmembrane) n=1 Tax=Ancylostoma caninum TaxID=29170 RepID=A0A368FRP5_ANCCA|nr:hypothetical protein ANCCAN_19270 [Ancylostoma caninum]